MAAAKNGPSNSTEEQEANFDVWKYGKMDENNTNVDHVTDTSQPCDPRCIIYIRSMEKVRLFMDVVNLGLSF